MVVFVGPVCLVVVVVRLLEALVLAPSMETAISFLVVAPVLPVVILLFRVACEGTAFSVVVACALSLLSLLVRSVVVGALLARIRL